MDRPRWLVLLGRQVYRLLGRHRLLYRFLTAAVAARMHRRKSRLRSVAALTLGLCLGTLAGCAGNEATRPAQSNAQLLASRDAGDARSAQDLSAMTGQLLARVKREHNAYAAGRSQKPPVLDVLVISGGGDWGAFGAGFLKGWRQVPAGPLALPQFDAVTGVSTGALIAPFAFLGDAQALDTIESLYRHPQPDWVKQRWPLYFLPANPSFYLLPGLERELRTALDRGMLERIAAQEASGRLLLVNTTNID